MEISTLKKALIVNSDPSLYGTFAEIGAGQEVARHFFRAGLASQTIAKTMSAYDMIFSDAIYGKSSRYVSKERLQKMLHHEFELLEERLHENSEKSFFAFADTVATSSNANQCHGWMGVRFQIKPDGAYNDLIIHVKMLDANRLQQQEALGILGVNLIYTALCLTKDNLPIVPSLTESVKKRVEVDYIQLDGPDLEDYDQDVLCLELVEQGLTQAVLFESNGPKMISDSLYGKPTLTMRGTFRPITNTNIEIVTNSIQQIKNNYKLKEDPQVLFEISMQHPQNANCSLDDYLNRIQMIQSLGHSTLISSFDFSYELTSYLRNAAANPITLIIGASVLDHLFNPDVYNHLSGGILNAFGQLFDEQTKIYVYPYKTDQICVTTQSYFPKEKEQGLYKFLIENKKIVDILGCDDVNTSILSEDVRKMLQNQNTDWEQHVPSSVADIIKNKKLFGYQPS